MSVRFIFIPLLFVSTVVHAIVNMEGLHTTTPRPGWSGNIDLALSGTQGNSDTVSHSGGARAQYHRGADTVFFLVSRQYGESGGIRNSDKWFSHLRLIHQTRDWLALEGYLQGESDAFARLELRTLAGAGVRFTPYSQEGIGQVHLGLGAFRVREQIDHAFADSGTDELTRLNSYLVLKYQISESAALVSSTYYQPDVADSGDYRLLEQAALKVQLTDRLDLVVSADYRHDSRPPTGVNDADFSYRTALSFDID